MTALKTESLEQYNARICAELERLRPINTAAAQAMREVLEDDLPHMTIENRGCWTEEQRDYAFQARAWMDGEDLESPTDFIHRTQN